MLRNKIEDFLSSDAKSDFVLPDINGIERRDIEKSYARVFSSDDGKKVLAHLQSISFMRAYGAEASDAQIRYAEGQRALVATIMRMVNNGRSGSH